MHEVWLKLAAGDDSPWGGSRHFFGAAAQAMRQIVVDHVRRRYAKKRGGGQPVGALDTGFALAQHGMPVDDVLAIDAALRSLERDHPRKAAVVVMRYFAGMSTLQIAAALEVTPRTVEREWRFARAHLAQILDGNAA